MIQAVEQVEIVSQGLFSMSEQEVIALGGDQRYNLDVWSDTGLQAQSAGEPFVRRRSGDSRVGPTPRSSKERRCSRTSFRRCYTLPPAAALAACWGERELGLRGVEAPEEETAGRVPEPRVLARGRAGNNGGRGASTAGPLPGQGMLRGCRAGFRHERAQAPTGLGGGQHREGRGGEGTVLKIAGPRADGQVGRRVEEALLRAQRGFRLGRMGAGATPERDRATLPCRQVTFADQLRTSKLAAWES